MERLTREFYTRDALTVAQELLGKVLVHRLEGQTLAGRIVEAEAYQGPEDRAAHSYAGRRTARTEVMFGPGGFAYVYLIYGMHCCMNVVASTTGKPQAVLLRAVEPAASSGRRRGRGSCARPFPLPGVAMDWTCAGTRCTCWTTASDRPLWPSPAASASITPGRPGTTPGAFTSQAIPTSPVGRDSAHISESREHHGI